LTQINSESFAVAVCFTTTMTEGVVTLTVADFATAVAAGFAAVET